MDHTILVMKIKYINISYHQSIENSRDQKIKMVIKPNCCTEQTSASVIVQMMRIVDGGRCVLCCEKHVAGGRVIVNLLLNLNGISFGSSSGRRRES